MESNNDVLLGMRLCERAYAQLKEGKRDQLTVSDLDIINQALNGALQKFPKDFDIFVVSPLSSITECISTLLARGDSVVDNETKLVIVGEFDKVMDVLYLSVGKYYMHHEFDYKSKLEDTLRRVVDNCVERGFYFDEEL